MKGIYQISRLLQKRPPFLGCVFYILSPPISNLFLLPPMFHFPTLLPSSSADKLGSDGVSGLEERFVSHNYYKFSAGYGIQSALRMSKKIGNQLYLVIDKVSTQINLFRLVKEVTILILVYLILWLPEVPMQITQLHGTSSD